MRGADATELFRLARTLVERMSERPALKNVYLSLDLTKPEYRIEVDRARAQALGLAVSDVALAAQSLVRGEVATRYRDGDEDYPVRIMVPERDLTGRAAIEDLPVACPRDAASCVRLADVATVTEGGGPVEIIREDQIKQVVVRADSAAASLGDALQDLSALLATFDLPAGYEVRLGGQAKLLGDAASDLVFVLAFALFFAFVILVVQFDRLLIPALILGTAPFSLGGVVLVLYATGIPAGTTVIVGMLVVVAAHVTEGVLLLTYAEEARREHGLLPADAVHSAATTRFRPRLMTGLGVMIGLTPLALNLEAGGDMLQPLAVAAVGGVAMPLFVALFLVPVLYAATSRRPALVAAPAAASPAA